MPAQDFDMVLFGGTGDLVMRKLLPALYQLFRHQQISPASRIVGVARTALSRNDYLAQIEHQCRPFLDDDYDAGIWHDFLKQVDYVTVDATNAVDYAALFNALNSATNRVRVFYLSVAPSLFTSICAHLAATGLITQNSRVVLEKPLGHDLASSRTINDAVGLHFAENQIYRIDHYLGKEPVQNLLALRFGNTLLEPLWRREWIRDVQITVAEQLGVEARGAFYDSTGALRDMVQNHLLQLLCIVAMEPPSSIEADQVRDAKLQVLRSLRPLTPGEIATKTVRGQYRAGAVAGQPVPGYLEEEAVPTNSRCETFVALKVEIDSWRWAGVPFFLRTGKRLQERVAEIVVNFHQVPHFIFGKILPQGSCNRLIIRMQPEESVNLHMLAKAPGDGMKLEAVSLSLDFTETFRTRRLEAYERLLMDVIGGRLTLFVRRDEQEAAWRWVEPILEGWAASGDAPKPYTAGTWGPAASSALLSRDALCWHEEM